MDNRLTVAIAALACALADGAAGCGGTTVARADDEQVTETTVFRGHFKNQYVGNALHEEITVRALSFLKRGVRNYLARTNANFDAVNLFIPSAHFDDCYFAATALEIQKRYDLAVKHADGFPLIAGCEGPSEYVDALCMAFGDSRTLDAFAGILHPVQDFYAHTNWVEYGRLEVAFPSDVPNHSQFPELTPYEPVGGLRIIDGDPPNGWTVRTAARGAVYPDNATITVKVPGPARPDEPALVSGRVFTDLRTHCPNFVGPGERQLDHGDLAKDAPPASLQTDEDRARSIAHANAVTLAVEQTKHEWCRLRQLVYDPNRFEAIDSLCENWVEDHAAADEGCPALPEEAKCRWRALSFRGSDTWVDLGNSPALNTAVQTIEAWVYLRSHPPPPAWLSVFNKWVGGAEDKWMSTGFFAAGVPDFGIWKGNPSDYIHAVGQSALSLNTWHHLAGVYDGHIAALYVDGVVAGTDLDAGPVSHASGRAYIGANPIRGLGGIDGFIGEVRISASAKYSASFQPARRMQVEPDTIGLWRLDEGQKPFIEDVSGNGLNGAVSPGAKWESVPPRR